MSESLPSPFPASGVIAQGTVEDHDDFGGLHRDLSSVVGRRRALQFLGGVSFVGVLAACSSSSSSATPTTGSATTGSTASATAATEGSATTVAGAAGASEASAGSPIPSEAAGPFPADGTNGPNLLAETGVERADITTSIGGLTGTAEGIPTKLQLTIVDAATGAALPGAAVYVWHCTATGQYSIYELNDQNYLRGVQVADDRGRVSFDSVFPGCYRGRWPHVHFEIYEGIADATSGGQPTKTSQLALPAADCEGAYADSRYGNSLDALSQLSLQTDIVFNDGWTEQLATVVGDTNGYTVSLLVRV